MTLGSVFNRPSRVLSVNKVNIQTYNIQVLLVTSVWFMFDLQTLFRWPETDETSPEGEIFL